jgi:O-antigen/teichoic acid export membrane protein
VSSVPSTTVPETEDARLRADTLADSVLILLVLTIVQRGIGFFRSIVVCRWLEPEQLGEWDMAFGFLNLAAPLAVLGLPGSFGRYVEHYRQKGQLKTFLRRTGICTFIGAVAALAVLLSANGWFSALVFGSRDFEDLMFVLSLVLATVIAHNTCTSLFTALRMYRVVSILQFINTMSFAAVSLGLLYYWRTDAMSVVAAYGISCLITAVLSALWLSGGWKGIPVNPMIRLPYSAMWAKLLPFAVWVWITNWLANTFDVADRYMIVHYSGLSAPEALMQVGQYHSSRVVPVLLVGVAELLANLLTPHLTQDWEAGHRHEVSHRLNLFLKMFGLGLVGASVAVMFAAPLLFGVAFEGKFAGGLHVLPWTLTYCCFSATLVMAQNYLWCAEKARFASIALAVALVVNVTINYLLLPVLGLLGAVLGTAAANAVALALVFVANRLHGMRVERGTVLIAALPAVFWLGPWVTLAATAVVIVAGLVDSRIFSHEDRKRMFEIGNHYVSRIRSYFRREHAVQP